MYKLFNKGQIMDEFEKTVEKFDEKGWSVIDRIEEKDSLPQVILRNHALKLTTVLELIETSDGSFKMITTDGEIAKFIKKTDVSWELVQ